MNRTVHDLSNGAIFCHLSDLEWRNNSTSNISETVQERDKVTRNRNLHTNTHTPTCTLFNGMISNDLECFKQNFNYINHLTRPLRDNWACFFSSIACFFITYTATQGTVFIWLYLSCVCVIWLLTLLWCSLFDSNIFNSFSFSCFLLL